MKWLLPISHLPVAHYHLEEWMHVRVWHLRIEAVRWARLNMSGSLLVLVVLLLLLLLQVQSLGTVDRQQRFRAGVALVIRAGVESCKGDRFAFSRKYTTVLLSIASQFRLTESEQVRRRRRRKERKSWNTRAVQRRVVVRVGRVGDAEIAWQFLLDRVRQFAKMWRVRCAVRVRNESFPLIFRYNVHPIILLVQYVDNLQSITKIVIKKYSLSISIRCFNSSKVLSVLWNKKKYSFQVWHSPYSFMSGSSLTLPRFTSNSSSTQGVKSCRMIILLSGDSPFSFSIPTRTRVSMDALPVIRPIPGGRIVSFSSAI